MNVVTKIINSIHSVSFKHRIFKALLEGVKPEKLRFDTTHWNLLIEYGKSCLKILVTNATHSSALGIQKWEIRATQCLHIGCLT
jgi:hypothetical protein